MAKNVAIAVASSGDAETIAAAKSTFAAWPGTPLFGMAKELPAISS